MDSAARWADFWGMALVRPLFPVRSVGLLGEHCAMLDGRRASFACSTVETPDISPEDSKNWQWSADLAHHVLITPNIVHVRSGRDPVFRKFQRDSVESRLEEFLKFLDNPRRSALPDVVSFLVEEFRAIWAASGSPDGANALVPFLLALCAAEQGNSDILNDPAWCLSTAQDIGIDDPDLLEARLNRSTVERARGLQSRAPLDLQLIPSLVLRHVAGRLFQEAHAIIETTQYDLFGNASIITSPTYSPAGAYFTPVPIARLLADWTLSRMSLPNEITIADYACGSAVFLTEALHTLERRGFRGTVRLIGRDKSRQAIRMAKVAVRTAQRDLAMGVISDISQADALDSEWPRADICLMNPPFRSWERMNQHERDWVQEVTQAKYRPDLSVGFVERAIQAINPNGVLATLVPAGVLASDSLSNWRNELVHRGTPTLVAVLGEHGLFEHALVNIGILALQNAAESNTTPLRAPLRVAWSSAETGAASRVIRAIRRSISGPNDSQPYGDSWSVKTTSIDAWLRRPSWLPGAGALGALLETIEANTITKVGDLFDVQQGIRTGANPLFIQPADVVKSLPEREQRYFKKAVDAASFVDGDLKPQNYLFLAPNKTWKTEEELSQAVPEFFNGYIRTNQELLKKRTSLRGRPYWELAEPRTSWMFKGPPRLLSKRFGLCPAFGRDFDLSFAVVQANAWRPTEMLTGSRRDTEELCEVLTAYWWLLNSRVAVALLREYCPNVAGGQLDLERKYVKHVPLPNLPRQFKENPTLPVLANSIRSRYPNKLPAISDRDRFAAEAFGTDVSEWNLSGLELPD
ncbi:MAG: N-6 DNA methylase [Candidatus Sulfotelmatobacter sp.]|jgi:predicted RNA methylase